MAVTVQEKKMVALLKKLGLPYRKIDVYGSQIVITCRSENTARRWATALSPKVAKFRGITESREHIKKNRGTMLRPTTVKVWRAFFRL